jgi:hypothetical protein
MRVLVLCECSGRVKSAFRDRGHEAYSCDLEPSEIEGDKYHIQDDANKYLTNEWDLIIAHPPCTYLANAGLHYLKTRPERRKQLEEGFTFVKSIWNAPVDKICIENPVGWLSTHWQKPTQIIQPYFFGEPEIKTTCLWLKGLPRLMYVLKDDMFYKSTATSYPKPHKEYIRKTGRDAGKIYRDYWHSVGNAKDRSRTFMCVAQAMATQWG